MKTIQERIQDSIERYSATEGRWITINGTHVQLDKSGIVVSGPDRLRGRMKAPEAPSWFRGKRKSPPQDTPEIEFKSAEKPKLKANLGADIYKMMLAHQAAEKQKKDDAEASREFDRKDAIARKLPPAAKDVKHSGLNAIKKQIKGGKRADGQFFSPEEMDELYRTFLFTMRKAMGMTEPTARDQQAFRDNPDHVLSKFSKRFTEAYAKSKAKLAAGQKSLFDDDFEDFPVPAIPVAEIPAPKEEKKTVVTEKFVAKPKVTTFKEARSEKPSKPVAKHGTPKGRHWITLHHGALGGKGSRVQIDDDGTIVLGHPSLVGKNLSDMKKVTESVKPDQEESTGEDRSADLRLADKLADRLASGEDLSAKELFAIANENHGGTRAENKYGQSQAYDSLEYAINKNLEGETDPRAKLYSAVEQARQMAKTVDQLPTQTNRDGNKVLMQQFSTPPHFAYAVNWLANIEPGDKVLEPSAGTGSLVVHAKNAGGDVYANELDPDRAQYLEDMLGKGKVSVENAEQIAGILPGRGVPKFDTIVMNPPFSSTAGRTDSKDILTGAKHIEEAAMLLKDGGRLVSIVGGGMGPDRSRYRDFFKKMQENGLILRANVLVSGEDIYSKYGTKFDSRVLVFDKTSKEDRLSEKPVFGEVDDISDLMELLEGVRNDRTRIDEPSSEQAGDETDQANGGKSEPGDSADSSAGASVSGDESDAIPGDDGTGEFGVSDGGTTERDSGVPADVGPGATGSGSSGESEALQSAIKRRTGRSRKGNAGGKGASGKDTGGKPPEQSDADKQRLRPPEPVAFESDSSGPVDKTGEGDVATQSDLGESLYDLYKPQALVKGAHPHATALVESAAMAAVKPPVATYRPVLSPDIVEKGMLSAAALETVVYAGQSHSQMLEADPGKPEMRRGYFIGDGTGAGKGRELSGVITDNFNQGRKKAVWLTKSQGLINDAVRDWVDVGNDKSDIFHFDKIRKGNNVPDDGIAFITYSTLRSKPKDASKKSNIDQLVDWLGPDFDGVIAFDEAHLMANAMNTEGERGIKKASQQALAGIELQQRLPSARVVYSSATGATELGNLAYAERLGIWGRGTPFADKNSFINDMSEGGVAAMEQIAQSLKATGSYCSRAIAMDDGTPNGKVTYDRLTHHLSDDQHEQYNALADGWQSVLENIDKALEMTGGSDSPQAKSAASSAFWGAQQRFFNQVMTSMQTPAVIEAMSADIKEGRSPVIQLVNTMEASTKRALAERGEDDEDADIDVSPRKILQQYLATCFPTERYESYTDEDGNERSRMVTQVKRDEHGKPTTNDKGEVLMEPVHDPRAVALRDKMLQDVAAYRIPDPPIDQIINHFGHEKVAEITGRSIRKIKMEEDDEPKFYPRNSAVANQAESKAFQDNQKNILIFSGAGDTGFSYHAARNIKNQGRRVHYMLQPGWRADAAVQGFGRTNRTNQSSAPHYRLVEIDELKGQKRFISTIARRLDQLGAITKGQRQTGGGGLFAASDNLESTEAKAALEQFFHNLKAGAIEGLDHTDVMRQLGLAKKEESNRKQGKDTPPPEMGQFLNRMLSMRVGMQGKVFEAYEKQLQQVVAKAIEDGTLDSGVENYPASQINRKQDSVVFREPKSGAEARHIIAKCKTKSDKMPFKEIESKSKQPEKFVRNKQSGHVYAAYKGVNETDPKTGEVKETYVLVGASGNRRSGVEKADLEGDWTARRYKDWKQPKFDKLDKDEAERLWKDQYDKIPDFSESDQHFLTGALLPIWDRIPGNKPKIYRMRLEDGQTIVGRHIPAKHVPEMLQRLGAHVEAESHTAAGTHSALTGGRHRAVLANGWKLKPVMVQGERRIELVGPSSMSEVRQIEADGVKKELKGGYDPHYYVPVGEDGVKVLERLTKSRPITEVAEIEKSKYSRPATTEGRIQAARATVMHAVEFVAMPRREFFQQAAVPKSRFEMAKERYARHKPASGQMSMESHWITLHGGSEGGGTHVEVDGKGNITKGPAGLAEKGIKNLSDFKKTEDKEPEYPARDDGRHIKEVWQMTKAEHAKIYGGKHGNHRLGSEVGTHLSGDTTLKPNQVDFDFAGSSLGISASEAKRAWNQFTWGTELPPVDVDKRHKHLVEQAVLAGKNVPDHILADYPDIAKLRNTNRKPVTDGDLDRLADNGIDIVKHPKGGWTAERDSHDEKGPYREHIGQSFASQQEAADAALNWAQPEKIKDPSQTKPHELSMGESTEKSLGELRTEFKSKMDEVDKRLEATTRQLQGEKSRAGRNISKIEDIENRYKRAKQEASDEKQKIVSHYSPRMINHPEHKAQQAKDAESWRTKKEQENKKIADNDKLMRKEQWDKIQSSGGVDAAKKTVQENLRQLQIKHNRTKESNRWKLPKPERFNRELEYLEDLQKEFGGESGIDRAQEAKSSPAVNREELEGQMLMYKDAIAIKKAKGEPIPQKWLDGMADISDKRGGRTPETGLVASNHVFGHPETTQDPKYANLIPIRVGDIESVNRKTEQAQEIYNQLASKISTAQWQEKNKKTNPKAAKAASAYLQSHEGQSDIQNRDMLRNETMPELQRLRRELAGQKQSPPEPINGEYHSKDVADKPISNEVYAQEMRKMIELANQPKGTLSGRAKEDFDSYKPIMERDVNKEVTPRKRANAAMYAMHDLHPDAQQALSDHLKTIAPEAHQHFHANKPIHFANVKAGDDSPEKTKYSRIANARIRFCGR